MDPLSSHRLSRRDLLRASVLATTASTGLAATEKTTTPLQRAAGGGPQNVVVVRADQLRARSLGCYGDPLARTPRIDQFARRASLHEQCFATEPVCSASRTAFDTGLHTFATKNGETLHPKEITIHGQMQAAGYRTFHVGKWHKTPLNLSGGSQVVPGKILVGLDYHAGHEWIHNLVNSVYYRNGQSFIIPAGPWRPQAYVDEFLGQIDATPAGTPFYGVLDLEPPHPPYKDVTGTKWDVFAAGEVPAPPNVPPASRDAAENDLARYYSMTCSVDEMFGQVLDHLELRGLMGTTMVVFTSDHGGHVGAHGFTGSKLQKRSMYEEALHVPLIVHAPWDNHGVRRGLFGTVDFMPLILGAAGLAPHAGAHSWNHVEGALYCQQLDGTNTPTGLAWRGVLRHDGMRYARNEAGPWVLFDVHADPYNRHNLIGTGDPREEELDALLREAARAVGDTIPW